MRSLSCVLVLCAIYVSFGDAGEGRVGISEANMGEPGALSGKQSGVGRRDQEDQEAIITALQGEIQAQRRVIAELRRKQSQDTLKEAGGDTLGEAGGDLAAAGARHGGKFNWHKHMMSLAKPTPPPPVRRRRSNANHHVDTNTFTTFSCEGMAVTYTPNTLPEEIKNGKVSKGSGNANDTPASYQFQRCNLRRRSPSKCAKLCVKTNSLGTKCETADYNLSWGSYVMEKPKMQRYINTAKNCYAMVGWWRRKSPKDINIFQGRASVNDVLKASICKKTTKGLLCKTKTVIVASYREGFGTDWQLANEGEKIVASMQDG